MHSLFMEFISWFCFWLQVQLYISRIKKSEWAGYKTFCFTLRWSERNVDLTIPVLINCHYPVNIIANK
jgi:hypothetical protein